MSRPRAAAHAAALSRASALHLSTSPYRNQKELTAYVSDTDVHVSDIVRAAGNGHSALVNRREHFNRQPPIAASAFEKTRFKDSSVPSDATISDSSRDTSACALHVRNPTTAVTETPSQRHPKRRPPTKDRRTLPSLDANVAETCWQVLELESADVAKMREISASGYGLPSAKKVLGRDGAGGEPWWWYDARNGILPNALAPAITALGKRQNFGG
ncbi:hypothetical protein DFP72DRAFT_860247 [Ephemerocybe angulata]|uniref:Uncharacterized protein n=1 Tax=Ephemerocybe angulata TaxID=980116 RepID=A0A8H6LU23_9AGAR|nr:hypothetical protein DFP72DRAFT_860956 [Tulosesus angulatus]KAF6742151.1 hypothetical protein DFP72DRAFT_860959 [Tulosesus angulatus]KAF6742700.1 hypothetical protein DFP72DRAFT_860247 [Tulosesus angulatus]